MARNTREKSKRQAKPSRKSAKVLPFKRRNVAPPLAPASAEVLPFRPHEACQNPSLGSRDKAETIPPPLAPEIADYQKSIDTTLIAACGGFLPFFISGWKSHRRAVTFKYHLELCAKQLRLGHPARAVAREVLGMVPDGYYPEDVNGYGWEAGD
jgi:hypothetical protein